MSYEEIMKSVEQLSFDKVTSSIRNPKDNSVVLVKNANAANVLEGNLCLAELDSLCVVTPKEILSPLSLPLPRTFIQWLPIDQPEYKFTLFHNEVNLYRYQRTAKAVVDSTGKIIPVHDGMKLVMSPSGRYIQMLHIGEVTLGKDVVIAQSSVLHRGIFENTYIGDNVRIGDLCNIGHNAVIEKDTLIMSGANIGGSVTMGAGCFVGLGALILSHISLVGGSMIGAGSVVTKSTVEPGVYYGNPAKRVRDWDGRW